MSAAVYQWEGMYPTGSDSRGLSPCMDCGLPHADERRHAILRRMLPADAWTIRDAYPHFWPPSDKAGERRLYRDLNAMGAARGADGVWSLP